MFKNIFIAFLSVLFGSLSVSAMQLGDLVIAGNGCFGSSKMVLVSAEEGRYALPIRAKLNKKSDSAFDRKTCNIRLPIALNQNEKLQLVNLSQVVRLVGYKGADVKSSLTMGLVGRVSKPLAFNLKITDEDISTAEILRADGVVAESDCGQSVMLTGNLSLLVNGSGTQAFVSTGAALITLKVVSCNH